MIAHVAEAGEGRGRVVLHVSAAAPSVYALEAAIRVARAFQSEIESLFVEDSGLFDIAALPFAREISLNGRQQRPLSPEMIERQCRSAAAAITRQISALASLAEVPVHVTVVRDEPILALAAACAARGPWNVVALADPMQPGDGARIRRLFAEVPGTTGLVVVGPHVRRSGGRLVAIVEEIGDFDAVLRTARRLQTVSPGTGLTLMLVADNREDAATMDDQVRLVIGADDSIDIVSACVEPHEPAVAAEIIRRLRAGFIISRFGGLIVPAEGNLKPLATVLECPLFLIR